MPERPELDEFQSRLESLKKHPLISPILKRGECSLGLLTLDAVADLLRKDEGYYFLIAAAGLNRTSLRKAALDPEAAIVEPTKRRAFAVMKRLPIRRDFADIVSGATALRKGDLDRKSRGGVEALFRDRLAAERIPLLMSPPVRQVPGILVGKRKPDGVFPDPASQLAPRVYLEIKNVRRVADDIQKRLYEIAEASLEMKLLYGTIRLEGMDLHLTKEVVEAPAEIRRKLREQIVASHPKVVVLFLCARAEAERYRGGAEAFVDRVFFQEEIEECLDYLRSVCR